MIEALTIVLAIGTSRDWRSTFAGTIAAIGTLGLIIVLFEPFLRRASYGNNLAIQNLWLIAGGLLLIFGLQWLRKAILRFTGLLPLHDEDAMYTRLRSEAQKEKGNSNRDIDWYAFAIVFKGVLLEGFEVVFIVLAFGAAEGNIRLGVSAAAAALVLVTLLGVALHRPLARLPENTMKFAVSIILVTFGTYFAGKGAGIIWPRGTTSAEVLLVFYLVVSFGIITLLKKNLPSGQTAKKGG